VLAPATLAALPSTRAIPDRDVFYVAEPISSIPDLWQQEAVRALQQGKDVVVQAPTGSGKTYIFELLYPNLKTQAVFTVPTRVVTTCSGTEPSSSTGIVKVPSRAAPARVHALHPKPPRSPIMHHKPLMIHHIYELGGLAWHAFAADTAATTPLRGTHVS
jgi:hypothetical protein